VDVNSKHKKRSIWGKISAILPLIYLLVFLVKCANEPEKSPFRSTSPTAVFLVRDWNAEYQVIIEGDNDQQPVLGTFEKAKDGYMRFIPTFPYTAGQTYEIIENGKDYLRFTPKSAEEPIDPKVGFKVVNFYPEVDTVPENLLKMYVTFSKSIDATQNIFDHLVVYDSDAKEVQNIFLQLENELWNRDRTEVTLWLDPGRIKKDLIPNQERGNPLIKRRSYEIALVENLRDVEGNRVFPFKKKFVVGQRDEEKPRLENWNMEPPAKGTQESLGMRFHESLDAKLFLETVTIYKADQQVVKGSFLMGKNAKSALFIPQKKWVSGRYTIKVESRLEDLAGNNLNRLFDVDLQNRGEEDDSEFKVLEFVVE
jgi:outer membrane lipoprotein-sorting protein